MTRPDISAIRARCAATTRGDWYFSIGCICTDLVPPHLPQSLVGGVVLFEPKFASVDDLQLVLRARTDLSALVAYAEEMEARAKELERVAEAARQTVATCGALLDVSDSGLMRHVSDTIQSLANALRQNSALAERSPS